MSADPTVEDNEITEPVDDPPVIDIALKRKRGRPPGALNKKTIAKQSALAAALATQAQDTGVQSKAARPKKRPPSSDGSSVTEQLVDRSPVVVVRRRKKKRVMVVEESDSSPSPIVVKRKRSSVPQPSPLATPEPSVAPIEQLGKALRDAQLDRMVAQHQRYNGYFARLCT
jgi:hypothetical protein